MKIDLLTRDIEAGEVVASTRVPFPAAVFGNDPGQISRPRMTCKTLPSGAVVGYIIRPETGPDIAPGAMRFQSMQPVAPVETEAEEIRVKTCYGAEPVGVAATLSEFGRKFGRIEKRTLLAAWASYLINGDASGLELAEKNQIDAYLNAEGLPFPVSCEPAGCGKPDNGGPAGDLEEFVFLIDN